MSFWQAVQTCFTKYIDFNGRAGRAEYWWFTLFLFVASFVVGFFESMAFGFEEESPQIISTIFSLGTLLPSISVSWRRLHDIGRSGWWGLLFFALCVVGASLVAVGLHEETNTTLIAVGAVVVLGTLAWVITWFAAKGEDGDNQYGPDPRAA